MITFLVGLLAQLGFSSRFLIQLWHSEKKGAVANPIAFWFCSLFASALMMGYGLLRHDLVIMLGQIINYVIYVRNISLKKAWPNRFFYLCSLCLPVFFFVWINTFNTHFSIVSIFQIQKGYSGLFLFGMVSQLIFNGRFLYQWLYSEGKNESHFPLGFWILSVIGGVGLSIYAVFRKDPILFLGQVSGLAIYSRNIVIHFRSQKRGY